MKKFWLFDANDRYTIVVKVNNLIVGGGISGMLVALLLAQRGEQVSLLDKASTGMESSWAGGGILSPLYPWRYPTAVTDLSSWSQQHYPKFLQTLKSATDIDPEWIQNGLLIQNIEAEYKQIQSWVDSNNFTARFIETEQALELQPELVGAGLCLWLPKIAQLRNPRFVKALRKALILSGVAVHENVEVTALTIRKQRVEAVQTTEGEISAARVVIASGAWSQQLLENTGINLHIEPVRGQMMLFRCPPNTVKRIILSNGYYLIPRKDGRVLIGSTLEYVGFNKSTTEQAREELYQAALQLMPVLRNFPVDHHWAGLRPGNNNGVPYICMHPELTNLYMNTGHFRNGIILGLASAHLLVNLILNEPPIINSQNYSVNIQ